jgi:hypothetical protein
LVDGAFWASVAFLADAFSRAANGAERSVEFERRFRAQASESWSVFRNFNERGRAERRSAASTD